MSTSKKFLDEIGVSYLWSKVKERDTELNNTILSIGEELNSTKDNVTSIETKVNEVEGTISGIEVTANTSSAKVDAMEKTVAEMKTTVDKVNNYNTVITALRTTVEGLETEVDTLNADVETEGSVDYKIKEFETELQTVLDTKASYILVEEQGQAISTLNETTATINETISTLNADENTVGSIDNKIKTAIESIPEIDTSSLQNQINTNTSNIATANSEISDIKVRLDVIEGEDEGSIKKAVSDGIAELVADAPEDLNTLKEIADYIAADKTGAAELNSTISELKKSVENFGASIEENSKNIESLTTQVETNTDNISTNTSSIQSEVTRATEAETELDKRITALEQGGGETFDPTELQNQINTNASNISNNSKSIEANTKDIELLENDVNTEGSIKYQIAQAKTELVDGAKTYTTLGKVETNLGNIASDMTTFNTNLNAEITRATEAETELSERITTLEEAETNFEGIKDITKGDAYILAVVNDEKVASISAVVTTMEAAGAETPTDGLATAVDTRVFIDKSIEAVNKVNDELEERVTATELFINECAITNEEIDALSETGSDTGEEEEDSPGDIV